MLFRALAQLFDEERQYRWEVLLINDGSRDATLRLLKEQNSKDNRFGYLSLSRNFGKEAAMLAGFDHAQGDCVVIMDADLQHPPTVIPSMLREWEAGNEDVYAMRTTRGREPWLRKVLTKFYYRLLQKVSDIEILPNVGDFRLLDRKCIDALRQLRESQRYTKGMYCWIGFTKKERFSVNLGGKQILQSLTIYLTINTLVNIIKLQMCVFFRTFVCAKKNKKSPICRAQRYKEIWTLASNWPDKIACE